MIVYMIEIPQVGLLLKQTRFIQLRCCDVRSLTSGTKRKELQVIITRCSAIAERLPCRVRYSFLSKVEDWNWETIFYWHYRSIFNHCDIIGLKICRIRWKKTQNRGYYGVQGHSKSSRSVLIESPYATSY